MKIFWHADFAKGRIEQKMLTNGKVKVFFILARRFREDADFLGVCASLGLTNLSQAKATMESAEAKENGLA